MICEKEGNGITLEVNRNYSKNPPKSYVWHNPEDLPRFLDGHKLTKFGYETDSRRSNFYRAENYFCFIMKDDISPRKNVFGSLENTAKFISNIWTSSWWQKRYDTLWTHIKDGRGTKRPKAWFDGKLTLPRKARNPLTVLHELTHLTTPKPHAGHGRLFCSRFKEIVGWVWGSETENILKKCYQSKNVKWYPHHKIPKKYRE